MQKEQPKLYGPIFIFHATLKQEKGQITETHKLAMIHLRSESIHAQFGSVHHPERSVWQFLKIWIAMKSKPDRPDLL